MFGGNVTGAKPGANGDEQVKYAVSPKKLSEGPQWHTACLTFMSNRKIFTEAS